MATSLVFKVIDPIGVPVASCRTLTDATIIASRHGNKSKIRHMHLGVLTTVGLMSTEREIFETAQKALSEKREEQRLKYERKFGKAG
jgi:hydroxyethylthiazole kinase-like sugar kinase family protein